jgi:putative IMPACT (imprinted ancient) family translation regulator
MLVDDNEVIIENAIAAYYEILEEKKSRKNSIGKQFEYNTYIRDFFEDNQGRSLDEAITCWKYKKSLQGHNRYEKSDLVALD